MNEMVAVLFYVLRDEALTYYAFKAFLSDERLAKFSPYGIAMIEERKRIMALLASHCRPLYEIFKKDSTEQLKNLLFLHEWLLLSFTRQFKFHQVPQNYLGNLSNNLLAYWDKLFSNPFPIFEFEIYTCFAVLKLHYTKVLRHWSPDALQNSSALYKSLFHAPKQHSVAEVLSVINSLFNQFYFK
jgi:Rab-GTPase-TBC domain